MLGRTFLSVCCLRRSIFPFRPLVSSSSVSVVGRGRPRALCDPARSRFCARVHRHCPHVRRHQGQHAPPDVNCAAQDCANASWSSGHACQWSVARTGGCAGRLGPLLQPAAAVGDQDLRRGVGGGGLARGRIRARSILSSRERHGCRRSLLVCYRVFVGWRGGISKEGGASECSIACLMMFCIAHTWVSRHYISSVYVVCVAKPLGGM